MNAPGPGPTAAVGNAWRTAQLAVGTGLNDLGPAVCVATDAKLAVTIRRTLEEGCGVNASGPEPADAEKPIYDYICSNCDEVCTQISAWFVHMRTAHGWVPNSERYAHGTSCQLCHLDLGTRDKYTRHLRRSTTKFCLAYAMSTCQASTDEQLEQQGLELLFNRQEFH